MVKLSPEAQYEACSSLEKRKKLGQFFTPKSISNALASWLTDGEEGKSFLDPAAGTGVLLESLFERSPGAQAMGIDLDDEPLKRAKSRLPGQCKLIQADYLETTFEEQFDGILANPPYIRHHDFKADNKHYRGQVLGKLSKLTNIYVLFISKIIEDLKPGGRAAILVPSDWTTSNFAEPLRLWLTRCGYLRRLVLFDTGGEVFHDNLSTGSILFLEKNPLSSLTEVLVVPADIEESLGSQLGNEELPSELRCYLREHRISELNPKEKWLSSLKGENHDVREGFTSLGTLASSKRGIATGANAFFHISKKQYDLETQKVAFRKCIGRAKDASGLIFGDRDFEQLEENGSPSRLLDLDEIFGAAYLEKGVSLELPKRYLLRTRKRWFDQETRSPADIWVGVFGRDGMRFIANEAGVHNLTCFHGLYTGLDLESNRALVAILNSSQVQKINTQHQRSYGAGLNKLEPKDLLSLFVMDVRTLSRETIQELSFSLERSDQKYRLNDPRWRDDLDKACSRLESEKLGDLIVI